LIKGGAAQLSRAFTNLIINAFEATQSNGKIILKTQNIYLDEPLSGYKTINRGEYIRVDISDTGSGIPNEIVNKIFDPFFTTKTTDKMRGSGLGLSVVHGVIEDHNGYITVESKPGTGSIFGIYLPISRDAQLDSAEVIENIKGGKELILVVDDDAMQRKVIGALLKRIGYKVNKVESGEKAIAFVKNSKPDLIILDMAMDGIDGTETYRQIKEIHSGQRAIMLSGYAMTQRVQEAINLGAGGFIAKPISFTNLAKTVREELDRPQDPGGISANTVKAGHVML